MEKREKRKCVLDLTKAGNVSVPIYISSNKYFRIQCAYYPTKRQKQSDKKPESFGYRTAEEAIAESELFRFAVATDGAKNWQQPRNRLENGVNKHHQIYLESFKEHGAIEGPSRADDVLSCAQSSQRQSLNVKV